MPEPVDDVQAWVDGAPVAVRERACHVRERRARQTPWGHSDGPARGGGQVADAGDRGGRVGAEDGCHVGQQERGGRGGTVPAERDTGTGMTCRIHPFDPGQDGGSVGQKDARGRAVGGGREQSRGPRVLAGQARRSRRPDSQGQVRAAS